jgi:uncharacterized protein (TIGR03086 family)
MPFEKSVIVPLSPGETFDLITQPDRLRRWQAITARVDLRAGGEYRWTIVPGHSARGTFTVVEPGQRVAFTWGWEGDTDLPPGASTVTITLEPSAGGTVVRLVHEQLTGEQAASHGGDWSHYLDRLVAAATSGDAGADDRAATPRDLNALTAAEATLAVCQQVLRGVAEADYGSATTCLKFTVTQLADHLIGSVTTLGGAAGAEFPGTATGTLEARLAEAAQPAMEAWDARGADGTVKVGTSEMPATAVLGILSIELLVHAWDFAQATGQQIAVPDELSAHVLGAAHTIITPEGRVNVGFDDPVEPSLDAGALDRLIAFTGRSA